MALDFSKCRDVWVPDDSEAGGFWSPPPTHVRVGVQQIVDNPYFLLADDMGGMKTAQAIISAQFLHDMDLIDRIVVVAPAGVRSKVWFDLDIAQLADQLWDTKLNIVTEYHDRMRRWSRGPKGTKALSWYVTNYEFIRSRANLAALVDLCDMRTMLILDESSMVRTYDSAQTEACMVLRWQTNAKKRPILGKPRCGRILELNGTPVGESNMDLFSQMNLLHPSILNCRYVTHFRARYAVVAPILGPGGKPVNSPYTKKVQQPDGTFRREAQPLTEVVGWSEEGIKDLQQRIAPYILRREAKDFGVDFALPPVALEVRLTDVTWRRYRQMRDQMVLELETGVGPAKQAGTKAIRLSQITSGFVGGVEEYDTDDGLFDLDAWDNGDAVPRRGQQVQEIGREKLDFALEWQAELLRKYPDLKLLTWSRHVFELRRYLREVEARFKHPVAAACGERIFDREGWNARMEREQALRLLHPKTAPAGACTVGATQGTGAFGLNFTACRTVLDMSYDMSAMKKRQGDARVNRTGQRHMVSFFHLIAVGPKGQKTYDHTIYLERMGKIRTNDWTVSAWVTALREE